MSCPEARPGSGWWKHCNRQIPKAEWEHLEATIGAQVEELLESIRALEAMHGKDFQTKYDHFTQALLRRCEGQGGNQGE